MWSFGAGGSVSDRRRRAATDAVERAYLAGGVSDVDRLEALHAVQSADNRGELDAALAALHGPPSAPPPADRGDPALHAGGDSPPARSSNASGRAAPPVRAGGAPDTAGLRVHAGAIALIVIAVVGVVGAGFVGGLIDDASGPDVDPVYSPPTTEPAPGNRAGGYALTFDHLESAGYPRVLALELDGMSATAQVPSVRGRGSVMVSFDGTVGAPRPVYDIHAIGSRPFGSDALDPADFDAALEVASDRLDVDLLHFIGVEVTRAKAGMRIAVITYAPTGSPTDAFDQVLVLDADAEVVRGPYLRDVFGERV